MTDLARTASLAILLTAIAGAADAATVEATSRIDAVAVHPDGAMVTRLVEAEVPAGTTTIVLRAQRGLTGGNVRIEGDAEGVVKVTGYDVSDEAPPAPVKALVEERTALEARLAAVEAKRKAILRYAEAGPGGDGNATRPVDDWAKAWDSVGGALERVNADVASAQSRIGQINGMLGSSPDAQRGAPVGSDSLRAMTRPMSPQLPGGIGFPTTVPTLDNAPKTLSVTVEASASGRVVLRLSHLASAQWYPQYDAKLTTAERIKPNLEIIRKAVVHQGTQEDWADVAMRIETAPIRTRTEAPKVRARRAKLGGQSPPGIAQRTLQGIQDALAPDIRLAEEASELARTSQNNIPMRPIEQSLASFDSRGTRQSYLLPGRVTLAKGARRTVRISASPIEPVLRAEIAPQLDPTAYLSAEFRWDDAVPLFEGPVTLVRDGAKAGTGSMPFLRPGETHALGFGADDLIGVQVGHDVGSRKDTGIINVEAIRTVDVTTTVTNRHAAPVEVRVSDAVPYSEDPDIVVDQVSLSPKPDATGTGVDRGVTAWQRTLAQGQRLDVRVAYRVKAPADRPLIIPPR